MVKHRDGFSLAAESLRQRVGENEIGAEHLERELAFEPEVAHGEDLGVAAAADEASQLVIGAECGAKPFRSELVVVVVAAARLTPISVSSRIGAADGTPQAGQNAASAGTG